MSRPYRSNDTGVCHCGNKPAPGKKSCQKCLDRGREVRAKHISAGRCSCGRELDGHGRKCSNCRALRERHRIGRPLRSEQIDISAARVVEILELQTKIENEPIAWRREEYREKMRKLVGE